MKSVWIATGLATALALPVLAANHDAPRGRMMQEPQTRAAVEARIKEHFAMMDANRDGVVDQAEASAAREKMMSTMRNARFATLDSNHDGSISRAEFDAGHAAGQPGSTDDHGGMHSGGRMGMMGMRHRGMMGGGEGMGGRMFARADANGDGKVTLAEATSRALARFDSADANKDGTLTPEERRAARQTMRERFRERRSQ